MDDDGSKVNVKWPPVIGNRETRVDGYSPPLCYFDYVDLRNVQDYRSLSPSLP